MASTRIQPQLLRGIYRRLERLFAGLPWVFPRKAPQSFPAGHLSSSEAKKRILRSQLDGLAYTDRLEFADIFDPFQLPESIKILNLRISRCPRFISLPNEIWAQQVSISDCDGFRAIPEDAVISSLTVEGCKEFRRLPETTSMSSITIRRCTNFTELPGKLHCHLLSMPESQLRTLPEYIKVENELDLRGSRFLISLPDFNTRTLTLANCTSFRTLPSSLECDVLNLAGCTAFQWPDFSFIEVRHLILSDCLQLNTIPEWLVIHDAIDVANTSLSSLPQTLRKCRILWRGVEIDEIIAFRPDAIKSTDILHERNVERRRVMLERFGWERFFSEVRHERRDSDSDPSGERTLLRFAFDDDEDLLILAVSCPSTGRKYFIRVPPSVQTCHEAAAWIAGFDNAEDYGPVVET